MKIEIYSTTSCPYCKMLKDYLGQKGVSFVEKLIDIDQLALDQMKLESGGFQGVPFTVITLADGKKEHVLGFDKGKLDTLLV